MSSLNRRAFLFLAALLVPVTRLRALAERALTSTSQPASVSVDEFLRLSERLVGRARLDPQLAATYLNALIAVPANIAPLAELARPAPSGAELTAAHAALERTIIEWWYIGTYTLDGEPRLATHTGALMWAALGIPAPGTCAGAFGGWSRPPQAAA